MIRLCSYTADAGTMLISVPNSEFGVGVGNGIGDGEFEAYYLKKDEKLPETARLELVVFGSFAIHEYDCDVESDIVGQVIGTSKKNRFFIYSDCEGDMYIRDMGE